MTQGWFRHQLGTFAFDVSWSIEPGKTLALFGPSGSGKTTTLRVIAGLLRPREGRIVIAERDVFDSAGQTWVAPHHRRAGYVPQQYLLFPHLTVRDNVAFGLRGLSKEEAAARVSDLLESLRISELAGRYPHQISLGQQQRVALARALAPKPSLLLLDEPFAALDVDLRIELRRALRRVREQAGVTTVLVTHDWADVLALADQVAVYEHGRVVQQAPPLSIERRATTEMRSAMSRIENVFEGVIVRLDPDGGTMLCNLGGVKLYTTYAPMDRGHPVRIGIRGADIVLASEEPRGLSARNVIAGVVQAVEADGHSRRVVVDCGRRFIVDVTQEAVKELAIVPGRRVWLIIKSNACVLIE